MINIKNCHSGLGKHFFNVNRYVIFIDLGIELRTAGNFILTEWSIHFIGTVKKKSQRKCWKNQIKIVFKYGNQLFWHRNSKFLVIVGEKVGNVGYWVLFGDSVCLSQCVEVHVYIHLFGDAQA